MTEDALTAEQIAVLYVEQLDRWTQEERGVEEPEVNALFLWEELICDDPERAWPVFREIVARRGDDETLYQVIYRLRILLHRHWDAFHERAEALVRETPRMSSVAGAGFFEPEQYADRPLDVDELIRAHEQMHQHHGGAHRVEEILSADPRRGLELAVEIIHRGPAHGMDSYDTFEPLHHLLWKSGDVVIESVENIARESYLVRRCIWRMIPGQRARPDEYSIDPQTWSRLLAANRGTTDFTDDIEPRPAPRTLGADDESLIAAWFAYEENFWAFSAMDDLVSEEPERAWPILLEMLRRTADPMYVGSLAAGPLEDLLRRHGELVFDRIAAEARTNAKLRDALGGVWIFEDDALYERYTALMQELT